MHSHWNFAGRGGHGPGGRGGGRGHGGGFMGRFGGFMDGKGRGFRAARMLASGDLQLIILALMKDKPRHGYEIIKDLEDRSSGVYVPSPGVVYPALTYLEEVGYAESEADGNKKLYKITKVGLEHLAKNQALVDETLEQLEAFGRKMAKVQKQFSDQDSEKEFDQNDPRMEKMADWRKIKLEFRELMHEMRAAVIEKIGAAPEEQKRILEILKKAIAEIRAK